MLDLILRRANLPDGRVGVDIGVANGQIVAIESSLAAAGARSAHHRQLQVHELRHFLDAGAHVAHAQSYGLRATLLGRRREKAGREVRVG